MSRRNKYGAKKTVVDGITFDSKREAARYQELKLLEYGGVISDLRLQPRYHLLAGFKLQGKVVRGITYVGDFEYIEVETGVKVIEDVKGKETDVFKMKWKMLKSKLKKYIESGEYELRIVK